ncbi:MAG: aldolase/citrate lyase family protein [Pseudomonadota bacterium]
MLELIQITNDVEFARRCDDLGGFRLWVDLERMGKAERQAGRNTFLSVHALEDVRRVKSVLRHSQLMVRVNPLHAGTRAEVDAVIGEGADLLMLPMFRTPGELMAFMDIVQGRVPVVPLLETAKAMACLDEWIATPGLAQVYVGLNDLHISLGHRFMFQSLALGLVDRVAGAASALQLPFGFGGIARMDEGQLAGRDVLAEHLRLGSHCVILSRTFHRAGEGGSFEEEVARLRSAEAQLSLRTPSQVEQDRMRIHAIITRIAAGLEPAR